VSTWSKRRQLVAIAAACLVTSMAPPAAAGARKPDAIDREVLSCITRVAGGRTWLARTLWALSEQEGGWVGAKLPNRDGSYDLGPLQINSWWIPRLAAVTGKGHAEVAWWLQHDACFNVDAARWIFLSALGLTHDYWKAIGVYHGPVSWRQAKYSRSVAAHLLRRFGPLVFVPKKRLACQGRARKAAD
jgi:hypothetical protein